MQHTTVLLHEAVDGLQLSPNDTVVDATFGSGGHAKEIAQKLSKKGCYIGIDADESALDQGNLERCLHRFIWFTTTSVKLRIYLVLYI